MATSHALLRETSRFSGRMQANSDETEVCLLLPLVGFQVGNWLLDQIGLMGLGNKVFQTAWRESCTFKFQLCAKWSLKGRLAPCIFLDTYLRCFEYNHVKSEQQLGMASGQMVPYFLQCACRNIRVFFSWLDSIQSHWQSRMEDFKRFHSMGCCSCKVGGLKSILHILLYCLFYPKVRMKNLDLILISLWGCPDSAKIRYILSDAVVDIIEKVYQVVEMRSKKSNESVGTNLT